jgi:tetratricopeptide (TPR) repeat protein
MDSDKSAFIMMPIGKDGSPEHAHFRALYDEILKPTISLLGYSAFRADEVQKSGAITKEIIKRVASADLVVVDITELNPNVFYELGVRHSLRARGTVMIIDETRTETIPFDIGSYRVIKFRGDLPGLGKLRRELTAFVVALNSPAEMEDRRDNPVHDFLPSLPENALDAANKSSEGELREKLAKAQAKLREYESRVGSVSDMASPGAPTALDVITQYLSEATEGNLLSDLTSAAEAAARKLDRKEFLAVLRKILDRPNVRLSPREYRLLAGNSEALGLDDVNRAIYDLARRAHPNNKDLRNSLLAVYAHSEDPADRERARQELLQILGITIAGNQVQMPNTLQRDDLYLYAVMLDAFYEDDMVGQAMSISTAAVERFPTKSIVVRNHAKSLAAMGEEEEALAWYQKALWCPDANDSTAIFFGNALHNRERHVDAAEVYLKACVLDPNDANGFVHFADEISLALEGQKMWAYLGKEFRHLPEGINVMTAEKAMLCALSCRLFSQENQDRCAGAAERCGIGLSNLMQTLQQEGMINLGERLDFASKCYELLRSNMTDPLLGDALALDAKIN